MMNTQLSIRLLIKRSSQLAAAMWLGFILAASTGAEETSTGTAVDDPASNAIDNGTEKVIEIVSEKAAESFDGTVVKDNAGESQADAAADSTGNVTNPTGAEASANTASTQESASPKARLPLGELRIFAEAFNRISSAYVDEIDDKTLLENAIRGLLAELDPHSAYLDSSSYSDLQETATGKYGGLGLEVGMENGFVKVITPMDDTPAARAGMEPGDLIIQIDDAPVKGMSLPEAIDNIRGEPGSEISMTVLKAGVSSPESLVLTREIIKVASLRHRKLDDDYGYIRIALFQSETGSEFEDAYSRLTADGDISGLIIDVRNNPGGVLESAVAVADLFIDQGLMIVNTDGRFEQVIAEYRATRPDITDDLPLVVLVNEGTASASEIVAGALQDHDRAVVMGTHTFGKGSVQTILPINNDSAIKLTTARYYTPNGHSIQAAGITPDIWVDQGKLTKAKANPWRVKESNLPGHLAAEADEKDGANDAKSNPDEKDSGIPGTREFVANDYQLNEALNLLKGMKIMARVQSRQSRENH